MPQQYGSFLLRSSLCTMWPLQCTKQTGFAFLEERDRAHCKALTPNCFSIAFFTMHFDVEEFARELNLLCFVLDCPYRGSTRSIASPPASMPLSTTPFTDGDTEAQRDPRQTGSDFSMFHYSSPRRCVPSRASAHFKRSCPPPAKSVGQRSATRR